MDLARAHTLALDYLLADQQEHNYEIFNLGIGQGVSVLEAIAAFENETGLLAGVQFHPESILSEYGHELLNNFLKTTKATIA